MYKIDSQLRGGFSCSWPPIHRFRQDGALVVRLLATLENSWQSAEIWKRVTPERAQEEKSSSGA